MKNKELRKSIVIQALKELQVENKPDQIVGIQPQTYTSQTIAVKANEIIRQNPSYCDIVEYTTKGVGAILASAFRNKTIEHLDMLRNPGIVFNGYTSDYYSFRFTGMEHSS